MRCPECDDRQFVELTREIENGEGRVIARQYECGNCLAEFTVETE